MDCSNLIDKIQHLLIKNEVEFFSGVGANEDLTKDAANLLNVQFPCEYICFLKKYGYLAVNGSEFYGLTRSGLAAKSIPCVIFATQTARARGDVSDKMIKIMSTGYGPSICIDMSQDAEYGVGSIISVPFSFKNDSKVEFLSQNFSSFILDEIQYLLE